MIGREFGYFVVAFKDWTSVRPGAPYAPSWICMCACDRLVTVRETDLVRYERTHCGCSAEPPDEKNPKSPKPPTDPMKVLRNTWRNMLSRCYIAADRSYKNYGGRGIKVCQRWHIFAHFAADMGPKPEAYMSIDRLDVNGDYEPGNCVWATPAEQAKNKRDTLPYEWRLYT